MNAAFSWLDANIVLRYLLNDHEDHSRRALSLIEKAESREINLFIPDYIVCEIVYVLQKKGYSREQICTELKRFLSIPGIYAEKHGAIMVALILYMNRNVDFSDALIYAECSASGDTLLTFNKKHFQRLGSEWREP